VNHAADPITGLVLTLALSFHSVRGEDDDDGGEEDDDGDDGDDDDGDDDDVESGLNALNGLPFS
jgi:hypothetical protein